MRTKKGNPKAVEFQSWVTGTVLPTIRKDGMYVAGEEKLDPNNEADLDQLVLTVMNRLQAKVERLAAENAVMKEERRSSPWMSTEP